MGKKTIWKQVRTTRDMPRKSGFYLMLTDMGWPLTFYWNAHCRTAYLLSNRNHYDEVKKEYVDDGKVDYVRMSLKYPSFFWTDIPGTVECKGVIVFDKD